MIKGAAAHSFYPSNKLAIPANLISDEERKQRWARIRSAMKEQGLSCLIIDGVGLIGWSYARYVTNGIPFDSYVVFPLEGEVTEIAYVDSHMACLRKVSWAEDIRAGGWLRPAWADWAVDRVKELGYEKEKIGVVGIGGFFPSPITSWMAYDSYRALQNGLAKATLVPASMLIDFLRLMKSDEEIRMIRKAAEIIDKAIEVAAELAAPGVKESYVYARMVEKVLEEGGELPTVFLMSAGPDVHKASHFQQDRMLRRGDIILTEVFACYGGYHAQINQPVAVGELSPEYEQLAEAVLESVAAGIKAWTPRSTWADVIDAMGRPILSRGFYHQNPGFHGVGICGAEAPFAISNGDGRQYDKYPEEQLEPFRHLPVHPNMTVGLEPMAALGARGLHLGPTILTTENEPEILTRYGRDIIRA